MPPSRLALNDTIHNPSSRAMPPRPRPTAQNRLRKKILDRAATGEISYGRAHQQLAHTHLIDLGINPGRTTSRGASDTLGGQLKLLGDLTGVNQLAQGVYGWRHPRRTVERSRAQTGVLAGTAVGPGGGFSRNPFLNTNPYITRPTIRSLKRGAKGFKNPQKSPVGYATFMTNRSYAAKGLADELRQGLYHARVARNANRDPFMHPALPHELDTLKFMQDLPHELDVFGLKGLKPQAIKDTDVIRQMLRLRVADSQRALEKDPGSRLSKQTRGLKASQDQLLKAGDLQPLPTRKPVTQPALEKYIRDQEAAARGYMPYAEMVRRPAGGEGGLGSDQAWHRSQHGVPLEAFPNPPQVEHYFPPGVLADEVNAYMKGTWGAEPGREIPPEIFEQQGMRGAMDWLQEHPTGGTRDPEVALDFIQSQLNDEWQMLRQRGEKRTIKTISGTGPELPGVHRFERPGREARHVYASMRHGAGSLPSQWYNLPPALQQLLKAYHRRRGEYSG